MGRRLGLVALGLVLAALPPFFPGHFWLHVVNITLIYAILALGQNVITGWCGMLTLGHAAFFGIGAYTSVLLAKNVGLPWILCFLASGVIAAAVGTLLAIPCLRVKSDFLSLVTIAFNQMFVVLANNAMSLTRGPMGLTNVPHIELGPWRAIGETAHYFVFLVIAGLVYAGVWLITRGPIGRAWSMIRDDEIAAATVGVNVRAYKLLAFAVGCFVAGLAGSLFAHFLRLVSPDMFQIEESLLLMQMAILGGLASLPGSALGALLMVSLPELLRSSEPWLITLRPGIAGAVLVALMIWRPNGLLGARTAAPAVFVRLSARLRHALHIAPAVP
jgi:branched-chain amino acid transport system permease protein